MRALAPAILILCAAAVPAAADGEERRFDADVLRSGAAAVQARMQLRGVKSEYELVLDEQRGFTFLHAWNQQRLALARSQLEELSRLLWRDLFRNRNRKPIHVVFLAREDGPAMFQEGQAGGYFVRGLNALFCVDLPSSRNHRASVVVHEFVHALHGADRDALGQEHAMWVVEGLACLFESSSVVEDRLVPHHTAPLPVVQKALAEGNALPWRKLTGLTREGFHEKSLVALAHATARYVMFYAWEKGLLQRFYEDLTRPDQKDRSGVASLELVFGRPLEEIEREFAAWVKEQKIPPGPLLGLAARPAERGAVVVHVIPGSGADAAGVRLDDVVLSADGVAIASQEDLVEVLATRFAGDAVELELLRGAETLRLRAILGARSR